MTDKRLDVLVVAHCDESALEYLLDRGAVRPFPTFANGPFGESMPKP